MEYKTISSKFTLQTQRKTEYGRQCKREYTITNVINSLYLQWKGLRKITKALRKIVKVFFRVSKINVKKNSHYILDHTFLFPSIGRESPAFMINWIVKSSTFRILIKKSSAITTALIIIISRYDITFYMQTQHILTHNV